MPSNFSFDTVTTAAAATAGPEPATLALLALLALLGIGFAAFGLTRRRALITGETDRLASNPSLARSIEHRFPTRPAELCKVSMRASSW